MTAKEATARIKEHMAAHKIGQYPHLKLAEALNMALTALRAQTEAEKNEPLTVEQLREMDGEPVWMERLGQREKSRWRIIKHSTGAGLHVEDEIDPNSYFGWDTYRRFWLAYRHKPKEG